MTVARQPGGRTVALSLIAALGLALQAAPPAAAADPYAIDVILPLTGGASFLGKAEQQALQIAEKVVNADGGIHGRPVQFMFHDDQSRPQTAVQLATQANASHPTAILGSAV